MAMVRGPLIDQLAIARRPRQQYPSGAAAQCFSHSNEFGTPALESPEILRNRVAQGWPRLALIAESVKEQLMQDHRIGRDQLFALQPVDQETSGFIEFELRKLFVDEIEPLNRAAVIVFIVADDEPLRHAFDAGWVTGQGLHLIGHCYLLGRSRNRSHQMKN